MGNPLVSVILTTKNEESNLRKVLNSVRNQTYKPIELIVVDATSTDDTLEICSVYADKILIQPSRPYCAVGEAKNMALCAAHGKYLAFTAASCEWEKDFIARAVADLEAHPEAPALFAAWSIDVKMDMSVIQPNQNVDGRILDNFILSSDLDVQSMLVRRERMLLWMPKGRNDDINFLYRFLHHNPHPLIATYLGNSYDRTHEKFWAAPYKDASTYVATIMVKLHTLFELGYPLDSLFFRYLVTPATQDTSVRVTVLTNILAKCFSRFIEQIEAGKTLSDMEYFSDVTLKTPEYFSHIPPHLLEAK